MAVYSLESAVRVAKRSAKATQTTSRIYRAPCRGTQRYRYRVVEPIVVKRLGTEDLGELVATVWPNGTVRE